LKNKSPDRPEQSAFNDQAIDSSALGLANQPDSEVQDKKLRHIVEEPQNEQTSDAPFDRANSLANSSNQDDSGNNAQQM